MKLNRKKTGSQTVSASTKPTSLIDGARQWIEDEFDKIGQSVCPDEMNDADNRSLLFAFYTAGVRLACGQIAHNVALPMGSATNGEFEKITGQTNAPPGAPGSPASIHTGPAIEVR